MTEDRFKIKLAAKIPDEVVVVSKDANSALYQAAVKFLTVERMPGWDTLHQENERLKKLLDQNGIQYGAAT